MGVTGWWVREEAVLRRLRHTQGLAYAPLDLRSEGIQLVTYDGEHLGHVRLDWLQGSRARWVAVPKREGRPVGAYGTAGEAAGALAQLAGKLIPPNGKAT